MECAKKNLWMQKIAGHIAGAIRNGGGRTVRHQYRVLWTDAMQTLDSYMRGLGFFCQILQKKISGVEEPHQVESVFLEPQLMEAILQNIYLNTNVLPMSKFGRMEGNSKQSFG